MSEQGTKKQSDTEFICKLCDMFQKYPKIVNWNGDGKKMIIFDIKKMEERVLPQYFRHKNFASFIRQLNMYDFHKLYKNDNQIAFKNEIFIRGNEKNFHFIQRKKRIKQQFLQTMQFQKKAEPILKRLKHQTKLQQQTKDVIHSLLEFKHIAYENTKKIRQQLQNVVKQLKDCRSKKISETLKLIKNQLYQNMTEQLKMVKEIDLMMDNQFLVEKENKQLLGNLGNLINSQFQLPLFSSDKHGPRQIFFDCNRMRSRHSFVALPSHCGFWSINDLNNMHPLIYSNPRIYSEVMQGQKTITKQQEPDSQEDDSLSMDRIGQEQLKKILNGQGEKHNQVQINENNSLKCQNV